MNKWERRKVVGTFVFCCTVTLCSCQSSLIDAVRQGDLEVVRTRIAEKPTTLQLNEAAAAAYSMGYFSVLNELAAAGAATAPDSVLNQSIEVTSASFCDFGCTECVDWSCFDASRQTAFKVFWPAVSQWMSTDVNRIMTWASANPCEIVSIDDGETIKINRFYKRTGWNTAEIYVSQHVSPGTSYVKLRYELRFETPSQGSFRCISQSRDCMDVSIGKFRLQAAPADSKG